MVFFKFIYRLNHNHFYRASREKANKLVGCDISDTGICDDVAAVVQVGGWIFPGLVGPGTITIPAEEMEITSRNHHKH